MVRATSLRDIASKFEKMTTNNDKNKKETSPQNSGTRRSDKRFSMFEGGALGPEAHHSTPASIDEITQNVSKDYVAELLRKLEGIDLLIFDL